MRPFAFIIVLALLSAVLIISALFVGSISLSWQTVWLSLLDSHADNASMIVTELRFPRALAAFATGALLAQSTSN